MNDLTEEDKEWIHSICINSKSAEDLIKCIKQNKFFYTQMPSSEEDLK